MGHQSPSDRWGGGHGAAVPLAHTCPGPGCLLSRICFAGLRPVRTLSWPWFVGEKMQQSSEITHSPRLSGRGGRGGFPRRPRDITSILSRPARGHGGSRSPAPPGITHSAATFSSRSSFAGKYTHTHTPSGAVTASVSNHQLHTRLPHLTHARPVCVCSTEEGRGTASSSWPVHLRQVDFASLSQTFTAVGATSLCRSGGAARLERCNYLLGGRGRWEDGGDMTACGCRPRGGQTDENIA